jgi:hypothetical protein
MRRKRIEGDRKRRQHTTIRRKFIPHHIGHGATEENTILETALHRFAPELNVLESITFKQITGEQKIFKIIVTLYLDIAVHSNGFLWCEYMK